MQGMRNTIRLTLAIVALFWSSEASAQWTLVSRVSGGSAPLGNGDYAGASISGSTAMVGQNGYVNVIMQGAAGAWSLASFISPASDPAIPIPGTFGNEVSVFGDVAVVGALSTTVGANPSQGAAYIFNRIAGSWTYAQTLTASDGAANDLFGKKLIFSQAGDHILVFAKGANGGSGALYVFGRVGASWTELQKLTGIHSGGVKFGQGRSMSANGTIVAGEPGLSGQGSRGFVYVCPRSGQGWACGAPMASPGTSGGDLFGISASFHDDDHFVVGASGELGAGNAYLFTKLNGAWTGEPLLPNMATSGSSFGIMVHASAGWIVIGAPNATVGGNPGQGAGYAYPFPRNDVSPQVLVDPLGFANESFGVRARMSGQTLLVDSSGAAGFTLFYGPTTPTGTSVTTPGPVGPSGSTSSVTFSTVTSEGGTNIVVDPHCPTVPSGLLTAGDCLSAVVSTTAAYAGGVSVCLPMPSPAPTGSLAVVQCDPNPGNQPCPLADIDPRLVHATADPFGSPLCCGSVIDTVTTAPGADPVCFTTSSLSLFAVGQALPAAPVPALGPNGWVSFGALFVALIGLLQIQSRLKKRTPV